MWTAVSALMLTQHSLQDPAAICQWNNRQGCAPGSLMPCGHGGRFLRTCRCLCSVLPRGGQRRLQAADAVVGAVDHRRLHLQASRLTCHFVYSSAASNASSVTDATVVVTAKTEQKHGTPGHNLGGILSFCQLCSKAVCLLPLFVSVACSCLGSLRSLCCSCLLGCHFCSRSPGSRCAII